MFTRSVAMASDIFAKMGDIKGESQDDKHKDEIEVLSVSWGVTNPGSMAYGSGAGEGKATFHEYSFVHKYDKASLVLMQACATGTPIKEVVITHRKAGKGQHEYLVTKMNDVIVTHVTQGGSGDGDHSENVSLSFAKVAVEYKPQKPDGSLDAAVTFKYDVKLNKEG
jgi:type VI secretion system secreted protein Hcp